MFTKGTFNYQTHEVSFLAKLSNEPSEFGIDKGRIFYLEVSIEEKTVAEYDRGWNYYPETEFEEGVLEQAIIEATIAKIAQEDLWIETLETRKSDNLDFHDVAVWSLKKALEAAYKAGQASQK